MCAITASSITDLPSPFTNPPPPTGTRLDTHQDVSIRWQPPPPVDQVFHDIDEDICALPDFVWLKSWCGHLSNIPPLPPQVPPSACMISTPLAVSAWRNLLLYHPNRELIHFFLSYHTRLPDRIRPCQLPTLLIQDKSALCIRTPGGDRRLSAVGASSITNCAYMPTSQFHLEGQKHCKNRDLPAQGGTVLISG